MNTHATSPQDVFLQIFSVGAAYAVIGAAIGLITGYVNILFPDALAYGASADRAGLRWYLAMLVILFPLYSGSVWLVGRGYAKNPATRELRTRRWLIYFTLFLAAVILAGDFVWLVYALLNGELTVRFVLKALAVAGVVGIASGYYAAEIRSASGALRAFAWVGITAAACVVVLGFFAVGSPAAERLRQFDLRRVNDLQSIQGELVNYWQLKGQLPASADLLRNDIRGFVLPADPKTGEAYGYRVEGPLTFSLCASFDAAGVPGGVSAPLPYGKSETWEHAAGRTCFDRTIDPQLYPPVGGQFRLKE